MWLVIGVNIESHTKEQSPASVTVVIPSASPELIRVALERQLAMV